MKNSLKFAELGKEFYSKVKPEKLNNSHLVHINEELKNKLKLNLTKKELLGVCAGEESLV